MGLRFTVIYKGRTKSKIFLAAVLNNDKSQKLQDLVLNDVTPLSLGQVDCHGVMKVFIKRNTKIPVTVTQRWETSKDNQKACSFMVYEGERAIAEDNIYLGKFVLEGIPPKKKGEVKFDNTFAIDKDGILNVKSICIENGK